MSLPNFLLEVGATGSEVEISNRSIPLRTTRDLQPREPRMIPRLASIVSGIGLADDVVHNSHYLLRHRSTTHRSGPGLDRPKKVEPVRSLYAATQRTKYPALAPRPGLRFPGEQESNGGAQGIRTLRHDS